MSKEEKTKEDLEKLCEALAGMPGAIKIAKSALEYIDQLENKIKELEANNYEANNIINDYIEDRKKLIDKLEKDIENHRAEMNNTNIKLNQIHYMKRIEYAKEILQIVKGENDEI